MAHDSRAPTDRPREGFSMDPTFDFDAELYPWKDDSSWVFLGVPLDISDEISEIVPERRGFGSVRVEVLLGSTSWKTSVFPDRASGCFVLPVKKTVRTAEGVDAGDTVGVALTVLID